jgi:hypothetical protein
MSGDKERQTAETDGDESAVTRAELGIEREKIQIERERLALERERLAAERERWKTDDTLRSRAEGRGIAVSTLVFVSIICALLGGLAVTLAFYRRQSPRTLREAGLEAFVARGTTNAATAGEPIVLRALDGSSGRGAYLLILN